MLKEALSYIVGKAEEVAQDRRARKLDFLSNDREVVFEHAGEITKEAIPPAPRKHNVAKVADLIDAANKWGQNGTIWISDGRIVLVTDDEGRRDMVTLSLIHTDVFKTVLKLAEGSTMDQPTLIKLLRREFRTSPQATTLLGCVRKLRFNRNESGYANVQVGNESMGRSVENAVTGADVAFLEELTLPLNVYKFAGEPTSIAFTFDVDVANQKLSLKPLPDEVAFAIHATLSGIRSDIIAGAPKTCSVFYGTP